jgi:integrase
MTIAYEEEFNQRDKKAKLQFSTDPIINGKVKQALAGLHQPGIQRYFLDFATDRDKELVADFILTCEFQENVTINTKRVYLIALSRLASHVRPAKTLEEMTASDINEYLRPLQRDRNVDPDQRWVNTYKTFAIPLLKFFKWLAYPNTTPADRKRIPRDKLPPVVRNLVIHGNNATKKRLKSPIKEEHIWHDEDVHIFLKYCTENARLRFYHALAFETSARPGELLRLRIKDINVQPSEDGSKQGALMEVGRYGKKETGRIVGMTELSLQYYIKYLNSDHPDPTNREAYVFVAKEFSSRYKNTPISPEALRADYRYFKVKYLPKLLSRPDVPGIDKEHLQKLRDTKKWHPYVLRHSSLTRLAPNVSDYTLRQHAGWTKSSQMPEVYTHGNPKDSAEDVMLAYGFSLQGNKRQRNTKLQREMVGPACPFCHSPNVPESQFCQECSRPISIVSMNQLMEELNELKEERIQFTKSAEKTESTVSRLEESMMSLQKRVSAYYNAVMAKEDQEKSKSMKPKSKK